MSVILYDRDYETETRPELRFAMPTLPISVAFAAVLIEESKGGNFCYWKGKSNSTEGASYVCTRKDLHLGPHAAIDVNELCLVWEV